MKYVIGVDGGATKTHALIVDQTGRAVGFGRSGGSNHQVDGLEPAMREVHAAVHIALRAAELSPQAVEIGCFCLAGADVSDDYTLLHSAVSQLGLASSVMINNDTMAALRAGLSRSWGVVVICGTGFNAAGRAPDGSEIKRPGLAFRSGDWSGGSTLAEEIIRAVMRAWDGRGKTTRLTELVFQALGVADEETLMLRMYRDEIPYRRLVELVPLLFEAALMGDQVAADLIMQTGREVGVTANALIRRLALENSDVEVVLGGSIFKGRGSLLLDTVRDVVHQAAPRAILTPLRHEPVFGAALLALEGVGITITEGLHHTLDETVQGLDAYPELENA